MGAPSTSEPFTQWVALATTIEYLPAVGLIDGGGGQLGGESYFLGRWGWQDDDAQAYQQVQRCAA